MVKQNIPFREDSAKSLCNHAFYGVKSVWPFSKLGGHDSDLAAIFGSISAYVIAIGGGEAVNFINRLGAPISLEEVALGCLAGLELGVLAAAKQGEKVIKWIEDNPIYSAGVYGIVSGASLKVFGVLYC